tara:strand:+ start:17586 stop:17969 length:384 start_codon:yes stop_codon:yes gene_type:complete
MIRGFVLTLSLISIPLSVDAAIFQNPLLIEFIRDLLYGFVRGIIYIGTPVIVVLFVYTGFLFTAALGNRERMRTARNQFVTTTIAATVLFSLWALIQIAGNTLSGLSAAALLVLLFAFFTYVRAKSS